MIDLETLGVNPDSVVMTLGLLNLIFSIRTSSQILEDIEEQSEKLDELRYNYGMVG